MPLFRKAPFQGKVDRLLVGADRAIGLEKSEIAALTLTFAGIDGDCHAGLTRKSDSRTLMLYRRDTDIRNVRQLSLLSVEELAEVAVAMGIPAVKPEWVGANLVTSGIPDLTLLPPSTRLQFPSGATLVVDLENAPCRFVADVIAKHHAEAAERWIKAATHKRGVTAWVEREGEVRRGDAITLFLPPQRLYAHG
ncbi:MAG: MOSC domain-containing protein [Hyphomicrobiales bacterium]